jgi:hypothetical protein
MKKSVINFYPQKEFYDGIFDNPIPAKDEIPEWYKKQNRYTGGEKVLSPEKGTYNTTIKACMPVFDLISAGYIIKTPADIMVTIGQDGAPNFSWAINDYTCIESHGPMQYDSFNIPKEFHPIGYKFINPWITQTPKGYSSIFMSPILRDDLPFQCLPAIVDTDNHPTPVNFPFFLRKDFEGLIPAGTPMIQIIPFKRQSWEISINKFNDAFDKIWRRAERHIKNRYKDNFRVLKEWN